MKLRVTGINHQTAPVSVRENVAVSSEKLPFALSALRRHVPHGIILSTCNRTEIYTIESDAFDVKNAMQSFLRESSGDVAGLPGYIYEYREKKVAEHLFRVTSGLESMIVGEFEILGQAKDALDKAEAEGMVSLPLRQLFNSAIGAGRRVRSETGISKNALSVSSVAVDFASSIIGDLSNSKMLIIGTGQAGKLVARVARERGINNITIASRTRERAFHLAEMLHGRPIALDNLIKEMVNSDIVITCAGAPHWLLDLQTVGKSMQKRLSGPLVIIDIALPRNVDPAVADLDNVFLYNIDDLNRVSDENRQQREMEISHAEEIINHEIDEFIQWWKQFKVRPTITSLMSHAEQVRTQQLNKTLKKLPPLNDEQLQSLESMTKSIVTKILKDPVHYLHNNQSSEQIQLVREMFRLDGENNP